MEKGRIAIPSQGQGGMDGLRAGHFGHCDVFTLVDVEGGKIKEISTVPNEEHSQGGCMVPVNLLAGHLVTTLIVGGRGLRRYARRRGRRKGCRCRWACRRGCLHRDHRDSQGGFGLPQGHIELYMVGGANLCKG